MIELINIIRGFQELDLETEEAIRKYFIKETFKKNDFIVRQGKVCAKMYFIQSGSIRRFCLENEIEVTRWIYTDNQFCNIFE